MAKASASIDANAALLPAANYAEFAQLGQEAIAAAMGSNAMLGAGMEAVGQEVAQYAHTAFASAGETARGLLGARTFEDVVRLQTDFAKRSFAGFIESSMKLSELGCMLLGAWSTRAKG